MSTSKRIAYTVASVAGSATAGRPIRVGGNLFNVQVGDPGASGLAQIEVSNDKTLWTVDTATLADGTLTQVTTRPMWARGGITADVGGPQDHHFGFNIFKETDG